MKNCPTRHHFLNRIIRLLLVTLTGLTLLSTPVIAKQLNADISISGSGIYAAGAQQITFMEMRVADPNGQIIFDERTDGSPIIWNVPGGAINGFYSYEVRLGKEPKKDKRENSQGTGPKTKAMVESGSVLIENGSVVTPTGEETSMLNTLLSVGGYAFTTVMDFIVSPVAADQVILDDLIVDGSECVGQDCVNGENFGFDTIRLKENNLRIHFDDTSTSASFPRNDWRIQINDSSNGGDSYFGVEDATAGRIPFRIEAGAPNNALYVENTGDVGIGTSLPVLDLHITRGDSPSIRLEQNGTSGWTPQSWDVAGNETNFFIRDVTNGSRLPFRIRPGAPTSTIDVSPSGDIGIGTSSPSARMHIRYTVVDDAKILFKVEGNPAAINAQTDIFTVGNDNKVVVSGNLELGSSKELKNNIESLGSDEALQTVAMLRPVKFQYKASPSEETIGFIAEEVPDLVATNSRKSISTMDVVAVLTKVVQEQQKAIDELNRTIATLQAKIDNSSTVPSNR